ncbi:sigma-54-dependent transcriptional regulator [Methylohalobius crimeensis]|uniref:sigma-54-dependent transcriptional regulator n=1 Tax=Methylohalobius crimeensis TaxID=244365 RepID=UPI0003B43FC7|nr:sigma-54 dependent transcriptional regulator [Methylohalobius crimeensis]
MTSNRLKGTILIVDDEPAICTMLAHLVSKAGLHPRIAYAGEDALHSLQIKPPDLLLLDYRLPDITGEEVLQEARARLPHLPVIVITAYADIGTAVASMRAGAVDYLAKPFDHKHLLAIIRANLPEPETAMPLHGATTVRTRIEETMGRSSAVRRLTNDVVQVAGSNFNVLVIGETGTGKELVSRAIHDASPRYGEPFVPVDCGALPESLVESELFGHEKGAFTGACVRKPGKFEQANGGTLFLDEISNMAASAQAKLLRAIQDRIVYRVGGTHALPVDVRIVAASNMDLASLMEQGSFRSDLFFRLSEFTVYVPLLRERCDDISFLVQRFVREANAELDKEIRGTTSEAIERLIGYSWPGNVRQLRNVIRRAALLAEDRIEVNHIDFFSSPDRIEDTAVSSLEQENIPLRELVRRNVVVVEKKALKLTLRKTGGNKLQAARMLSIDYKTLLNKVKEYGIEC